MPFGFSDIGEFVIGVSAGAVVSFVLLGSIAIWCRWSPRLWESPERR